VQKSQKPLRPGLICEFTGELPLTKGRATHAFRGFKLNRATPLRPDLKEDRGIVAAVLRQEPSIDRKKLADRLFYSRPTHWVSFEAQILGNPQRRVSLLKLALALDEPGRDSNSLLHKMLKFCAFQATELQQGVLIFNDGPFKIYEESLLMTGGPLTKLYWTTSLLIKFEDLLQPPL